MSIYKAKWKIKCPKCDYLITHDDYDCDNCGKGQLRARTTVYGRKVEIRLGCNKCAYKNYAAIVDCPKCGAAANLENKGQEGVNKVVVFGFLFLLLLFVGLVAIMVLEG